MYVITSANKPRLFSHTIPIRTAKAQNQTNHKQNASEWEKRVAFNKSSNQRNERTNENKDRDNRKPNL